VAVSPFELSLEPCTEHNGFLGRIHFIPALFAFQHGTLAVERIAAELCRALTKNVVVT